MFESGIKKGGVAPTPPTEKNITFAAYTAHWLAEVAPHKLAKSTLVRSRIELARVLPHIGRVRLQDLRADHFRTLYAAMRKEQNKRTGAPLAEKTVEGIHAVVCSVLSSAMEEDYLNHNPAWRTYRWQGARTERICADRETLQEVLEILAKGDKKYEVYFKLIIATGIRRGECCGLKWSDIHFAARKIHIQRNTVKVSGEAIFTKAPKTSSGDRWVYISPELAELLGEYRAQCAEQMQFYEGRTLAPDAHLFRKVGTDLPMSPNTFTHWFKKMLQENALPTGLNIHSLRHSVASLLIADGTDVATVSSLLGHAQVSTTLDIYAHAFDSNKKAASEQLQRGLGV